MAGFWDTIKAITSDDLGPVEDSPEGENLKATKKIKDPQALEAIIKSPETGEMEKYIARKSLKELISSGGIPISAPSPEAPNSSSPTMQNLLSPTPMTLPGDRLGQTLDSSSTTKVTGGGSTTTSSKKLPDIQEPYSPGSPEQGKFNEGIKSTIEATAPKLQEADREKFNQRRAEEAKSLEGKLGSQDWGQVAEMFGHALTKLGAGLYGQKKNVDLSGLQLDKINWDKRKDQLIGQHESILSQINHEESLADKDLDKINQLKIDASKMEREIKVNDLISDKAREQKLTDEKRKAGTVETTTTTEAPKTTRVTATKEMDPLKIAKEAKVSDKEADMLTSLEDSRNILESTYSDWKSMIGNKGTAGQIGSAVAGMIPATEANTYKDLLTSRARKIARSYEKGNMSNDDAKAATKAQPTTTDTEESAKKKYMEGVGAINYSMYSKLKQLEDQGKNVMKQRADFFTRMSDEEKADLAKRLK